MWPFKKRLPEVTLKILLSPSGGASVQMDGKPGEPLCLLALCYLAKVRWLLDSEPPVVLQSLMHLLAQSMERWPRQPSKNFIDSLPYTALRKISTEPGGWTVPGGEAFTIRLFRDGLAHVENDIPTPGLSINLAWHYVYVLSYCIEHLDPDSFAALYLSIRRFGDHLFLGAENRGLSSLRYLNRVSNDIWHQMRGVVSNSRENAFDIPWAWEVVGAFGKTLENLGNAYAVSEDRLPCKKEMVKDAFQVLLSSDPGKPAFENLSAAYIDLSHFIEGPLGLRAEEVCLRFKEEGLDSMTEEDRQLFSQITRTVAEESQSLASELKTMIENLGESAYKGLSPA